eukprot:6472701-Amphidinium_carterae.2
MPKKAVACKDKGKHQKQAVLGAAKLARKRASAWAAADSESEEEPTWKVERAAFTGVAAPETTYSGSTRTYIGKVGRIADVAKWAEHNRVPDHRGDVHWQCHLPARGCTIVSTSQLLVRFDGGWIVISDCQGQIVVEGGCGSTKRLLKGSACLNMLRLAIRSSESRSS